MADLTDEQLAEIERAADEAEVDGKDWEPSWGCSRPGVRLSVWATRALIAALRSERKRREKAEADAAACRVDCERADEALVEAMEGAERAREALSACAGFLTALRDDDSDYDFTLSQYEQIGRLCQLAFHALADPSPSEEQP